jgi:cell wall-associated NlpC family hydrolase
VKPSLSLGHYVGQPHEGCWAFVRRVYREQLGVELAEDPLVARTQVTEVPAPDLYDIALMSSPIGRHVGIFVGANRLLHSCEGKNVCVERLDSRRARYFRRPGSRPQARVL